jgi:hypothetical protein
MEIRNPSYNAFGTIDCEINHPKLGWIPFTASATDSEELGRQIHADILAGKAGEISTYVAPPPQPTPVPPEVSRFQARAALLQTGFLADVQAYMDDPATDPFVRIAWQDAQVFKRQSPTVLSLQPLLGLTDGQLDDLFRFAATIEA